MDIFHLEVVDSTNAYARRWLMEDENRESGLPVVFVAERQTAGRGRGSHRWHSPEGCLMFSVLFTRGHWNLPLERTPLLGLATGLSIVDTCVEFFPDLASRLKIHWPNDVYDHFFPALPRKLSGILTEGLPDGHMIVGVGINFENRSEEVEDLEIADRMISLVEMRPPEVGMPTKDAFLRVVLEKLEERFSQLSANFPSIISAVDAICSQKNTSTRLRTPRGTVSGFCTGLATDGGLCIDGKTYYTGDLENR